jgi:hypothetical protein
VPGTSIKVKAETATGEWSSGINYSYDTATGVLTLTGNGSTTVGSSTVVIDPWSGPFSTINEPFSNISRIVISEGITSIGDMAFADWGISNNLTIEIPSTVTSIGSFAFSSMTSGSVSVIMNARPDNITTFNTNAFNGSRNGEFITPYASEWKESGKCSYDSTNNKITFDNIYTGIFTLSGVTYTVTYKVINGTWSDDSTTDKTETVASGENPASVPTGMKANSGYTGGSWDTDPSTATITGATTFTYTFNSEADSDGSLIVESADGAPACEAGGLTSDDIDEIAAAENFEGVGAPDLALKLEVSNIDETVSAGEKEIAENYAAAMGEDVRIAMYTDMSLFLVGGGHTRQVNDLGRKALTVSMTVPDRFRAPAGFTRHFIVIQIHDGTAAEVGRSTSMRIPVKASRFSTYILAYYDVEDGGSGSHEHSHHICEDGHKFAYCVMQAPTTEVDGFAEWRCTQCGIYDWNDHDNADARETVTLSAYPVFNDTLENNIKAAEAGATVSIETKRWVSVRRGVLEALAEKPGVTLSIGFAKDGTDYVLTIPGGDPALAGILATEDNFFNFVALGNTYGLTAVEK